MSIGKPQWKPGRWWVRVLQTVGVLLGLSGIGYGLVWWIWQ